MAEAAQRARFAGDLVLLKLADPHAGYNELEQVIDKVRRLLLEADEVVANLTGGTTVMGIGVQRLVDEARNLARPCKSFVLIDRRPPAVQDTEPYIASDFIWLDRASGGC